jgi:hypothetical protein
MATPKKPKVPAQEPIEQITKVTESSTEQKKREKKRLLSMSGKRSTFVSGIAGALKERLGL